MQSFPSLSGHAFIVIDQKDRSEAASPTQPPMEQIDPAIKDIQIVSGRGLIPPFTPEKCGLLDKINGLEEAGSW